MAAARPSCPRCGHSIGPYGVHDGTCQVCRGLRPAVDNLARIGPYHGPLGELVRAFKYGGNDHLDLELARLLGDALRQTGWFNTADAICFVPTHWTRLVARRFYAPRVLARAVARLTGVPLAPLLRRVSAGPHQLDVPLPDRPANIRDRFQLARGTRFVVPAGGSPGRGARICLVDDVSTTGATLHECARVLKQAGAAFVGAAVIAKVDTAIHAAPKDV